MTPPGSTAGDAALCLYGRNSAHVDCVALTWPDASGPPVVGAHIPLDDPSVQRPVVLPPVNFGPACPS